MISAISSALKPPPLSAVGMVFVTGARLSVASALSWLTAPDSVNVGTTATASGGSGVPVSGADWAAKVGVTVGWATVSGGDATSPEFGAEPMPVVPPPVPGAAPTPPPLGSLATGTGTLSAVFSVGTALGAPPGSAVACDASVGVTASESYPLLSSAVAAPAAAPGCTYSACRVRSTTAALLSFPELPPPAELSTTSSASDAATPALAIRIPAKYGVSPRDGAGAVSCCGVSAKERGATASGSPASDAFTARSASSFARHSAQEARCDCTAARRSGMSSPSRKVESSERGWRFRNENRFIGLHLFDGIFRAKVPPALAGTPADAPAPG